MCAPTKFGQNQIHFEIMADGTISIKTGSFSPAVHKSADDLIEMLADFTGGQHAIERKAGHVHVRHGENVGQTVHQQ